MTVARFGSVASFLRQAGLMTVLLAVATAIVALHLLSGAHATAADAGALTGPNLPAAADSTHSPAASSGGVEVGARSSCTTAADCPDMSHTASSCVLSAGKTAPSPQPPVAAFGTHAAPRAHSAGLPYVYLGAAPSPGDFCVSRT